MGTNLDIVRLCLIDLSFTYQTYDCNKLYEHIYNECKSLEYEAIQPECEYIITFNVAPEVLPLSPNYTDIGGNVYHVDLTY